MLALWWLPLLAKTQSVTVALAPPSFSHPPSLYDLPFALTLETSEEAAQIRFTLDGTEPSQDARRYTAPILLTTTTVVKAIAVAPGRESSSIEVGTYLIGENIAPGFSVVSLSVDSLVLFDTLSGYYTRGPKATWNLSEAAPNYWKRVEFPMHFEFFDQEGERVVAQRIGAKIFGNCSRSLPQKSFRLTARKKYGNKRLDYNFFPNRDLYSYKSLIIRNSGTDWNHVHFRDAFVHNYVDGHTFLDTQAARTCVVFINGKYWGVYHLRELIDSHMIASHHDLNPDFINILEGSHEPKEGNNHDFMELCDFVQNHDLSLDANYDSVGAELDIRNLVDYWAVEVWFANWDWMDKNTRFWREAATDSPWQYILWDLDTGLGSVEPNGKNLFLHHFDKTWTHHVLILRALLKNQKFKTYFVNRFADLLNTLFAPEPLLTQLDVWVDLMSPEMPRHFDTWSKENFNDTWGKVTRGTYENWLHREVVIVRNFFRERQATARKDLQETIGLKNQLPLSLNVYPPGAGKIKVNTVAVSSFPWKGIYFDGVPVTLTALPNPGYSFDSWQDDKSGKAILDQSATLHLDLNGLDSFSVHFTGFPVTPVLTITEIKNRKSSRLDVGDWVEFYNPGKVPFDLSGWRMKDNKNDNRFVFPPGTTVEAGGYLVVVQDTAAFSSVYPDVHPVVGPFPFGLNKKQDEVRLFDPSFQEYLRVSYGNEAALPQRVSEEGLSQEAVAPITDTAFPSSWRFSRGKGTPGR